MADANPAATALGAAAQSLRDTAKWLAGGVAATAAGVFAGSSLTSLGTLDPSHDWWRLKIAGGGVLLGFLGLAAIMAAAIFVMMRESTTFRELADDASAEARPAKAKMVSRYRSELNGAANLRAYANNIDAAYAANPRTQAQIDLLASAADLCELICADANFFLVKARFWIMLLALAGGTVAAIIGFGAFAWAANPPKPSAPAATAVTIPGLKCQ